VYSSFWQHLLLIEMYLRLHDVDALVLRENLKPAEKAATLRDFKARRLGSAFTSHDVKQPLRKRLSQSSTVCSGRCRCTGFFEGRACGECNSVLAGLEEGSGPHATC
jgi:hypothetical protein